MSSTRASRSRSRTGRTANRVAIPQVAIHAGQYGWGLIYGHGDVAVNANVSAHAVLHTSASAGRLDDNTGSSADPIDGITLTSTTSAIGVYPAAQLAVRDDLMRLAFNPALTHRAPMYTPGQFSFDDAGKGWVYVQAQAFVHIHRACRLDTPTFHVERIATTTTAKAIGSASRS